MGYRPVFRDDLMPDIPPKLDENGKPTKSRFLWKANKNCPNYIRDMIVRIEKRIENNKKSKIEGEIENDKEN